MSILHTRWCSSRQIPHFEISFLLQIRFVSWPATSALQLILFQLPVFLHIQWFQNDSERKWYPSLYTTRFTVWVFVRSVCSIALTHACWSKRTPWENVVGGPIHSECNSNHHFISSFFVILFFIHLFVYLFFFSFIYSFLCLL